MSTLTSPAKKKPLTLAQLSSYDDIITDVLVDHAYYWTTIRKNRPSYHPSRGVTEEEITKIIQTHLIVDPDLEVAESKLLATSGLRRFYNGLKTPKEQSDFRAHLQRYMRIHLPDCPFEVNSTNRYTIYDHEASITARKYVKRGQPIKYLSGIQVMISATEDMELAQRKKDFSIVISARNKCAALFMGPARFANHDCNANARLVITGQAGIEIVATRNIYVGDEITISYAANYFGENNCECLCKTCEDKAVNGWAPDDGSVAVRKSIEDSFPEGYSFRRRRRDDRSASGSRTSSVTPDIRPRIRRCKPMKTKTGGPERESLCESPGPQDGLQEKRKRDYDTLQSPPITPAKRVKTVQYEVESVSISGGLEVRKSDETTSSEHSGSSFMSNDTAMTDATTPPEEPQDTALQSPESTPVRNTVPASGGEESESSSLTDFSRTPSLPPALNAAVPNLEDSTTTVSNPEIVTQPDEGTSNASAANWEEPAPTENYRPDEPMSVDADASPVKASAGSLEEPLPVSTESRGDVLDASHQEQDGDEIHETDGQQMAEGHSTAHSVDDAFKVPAKRTPGDYTLTPVLLSEACMAWIHCTNCGEAFVQQDAYYTRSSCFRCERHSKLYGYPWPKTEKTGPTDKEERVLDHRTIHRFLGPEDEARIRGRKFMPPPARPKPTPVPRLIPGSEGLGEPSLEGHTEFSEAPGSESGLSYMSDASKRGPGRPKKAPKPKEKPAKPKNPDAKPRERSVKPKIETPIVPVDRPKRARKPSLKAAESMSDALFLAGA